MNETLEQDKSKATRAEKPAKKKAHWTRRAFIGAGLLTSGALVVGVALRPGNPVSKLKPIVARGDGEELINSWIKIDADNIITAIVPHCEMGQGALSTIAQMLADEMDADWAKVKVIDAPADGNYVSNDTLRVFFAPGLKGGALMEPSYDGIFTQIAKLAGGYITGGSSSVRSTGQYGMRIAGAAAREMLVAAAAEAWSVPPSEIRTANSTLFHSSGKSESYTKFAAAAAEQSLPREPKLKTAKDFKLMGKSAPRKDIPSKVNGTAIFGIDGGPEGQEGQEGPEGQKTQNLKYAAIKAVPVIGSHVESIDASQAKMMPGVLQILNMGDFIAVVADSYWQAQRALRSIGVTYAKTDNDALNSDKLFARFGKALDDAGDNGGKSKANEGNALEAFASANKKIEAEYKVPFLAHATMEPMNCTAWVREGKCDIWTGTQVPLWARSAAAKGAGVGDDAVTMHSVFLGGGFGRRLDPDYVTQAARIAKATGYPVKMIWSREEDMAQDLYRPADISRFKGALDDQGKLVSWNNIHCTSDEPNESALVDFYDIENVSVRHAKVDMYLRLGSWRSVSHSQHGFFVESFLDELAHEAGEDPFAFRLGLLSQSPRHSAVLEGAAKMANWGSALPEGQGRGIALVRSFNSIVAEVAEVDMSSSKPRVTKVFCCIDPGFVMNPDGLTAQMESGIIYGLTAALYDEITVKDGAVQQSNFHDYHMIRMDDAPQIAVQIINGAPDNLGGAGEPGLPPAAPAVTNAIFAATGKRIRELPIAKHFA